MNNQPSIGIGISVNPNISKISLIQHSMPLLGHDIFYGGFKGRYIKVIGGSPTLSNRYRETLQQEFSIKFILCFCIWKSRMKNIQIFS